MTHLKSSIVFKISDPKFLPLLTNFGETTVAVALVKAGIPLADAQLIAKVVVFFLL